MMKYQSHVVLLIGLSFLPLRTSAQEITLAQTNPPELTVEANFANSWINRRDLIELRLSRALQPEEGTLAVFIGRTDMTGLFTVTKEKLSYRPDVLPLPTGETELIVNLVSPTHGWREIARFTLRVLTAGGFEKANFIPSLNLNNKGQIAEGHHPATIALPRETYQDFTGQLNLQTEHVSGGATLRSQINIIGVSYRNEALRYGEKGERAPKVDLSSYQLQIQQSIVQFSLGHIYHGRQRHLINSYGSRGTMFSATFGSRADLSFAAMNGTSIVGWENFLGLREKDHRILSGTLGLEFFVRRPGALRVETSYVDGSLLPRNPYNQGTINDAEKSRGLGFRLVASDASQRLRLESGFARSRFRNPTDPFLSQGQDLVPVRENTKQARYWDVAVGILRNLSLRQNLQANLTVNYRHERVDPLYRSVAAYARPDFLENVFDVQGNVGVVTTQFSHSRSEDNLDNIPSVLKTKTRRNAVNVGMPLALLFGSPARPLSWFPMLTYGYDRTHQFGAALPVNAGFAESHVPDQMNNMHSTGLDWMGNRWRFGYRLGYALQDNRQVGREKADFVNRTNTFSLGLTPLSMLNLNFDVAFDGAQSKEIDRIDRTRRYGLNMTLQTTKNSALNAYLSTTKARDDDKTSERENSIINVDWSLRFGFGHGETKLVQGQLFVRYGWQEAVYNDNLFGFDSQSKNWSINTGVNLSLF
ncbi:MAG: hypothetical protein ONB44_06100 [candidate division KSB1 bacterium]|nr:hypothetical protein [candidate division KSB1 bacterium]MDZ7301694.1 hypothetical protein [candidate division KSB1 bacterium]MDZ7312419.1 hypothetical protein [candidate division KSB1 bacterium]